jgi:hypothetical protein
MLDGEDVVALVAAMPDGRGGDEYDDGRGARRRGVVLVVPLPALTARGATGVVAAGATRDEVATGATPTSSSPSLRCPRRPWRRRRRRGARWRRGRRRAVARVVPGGRDAPAGVLAAGRRGARCSTRSAPIRRWRRAGGPDAGDGRGGGGVTRARWAARGASSRPSYLSSCPSSRCPRCPTGVVSAERWDRRERGRRRGRRRHEDGDER